MQEIERSRLSIHPAIRHPYKHASDACARHINCLVLRIRLWNSMDPMGAPKDCDLLMKAPPLQTAARQRWRGNHDTTRHIRRRGGVAYFMFHRTRIQCVFTPSHAHRIRENSPTRGAKKASACRGGAAHVDPSSIGWKTSSSRRYSRIFSDTYFFLPSLFSSKDDELSDLKLKRLFLFLFGILIIEWEKKYISRID